MSNSGWTLIRVWTWQRERFDSVSNETLKRFEADSWDLRPTHE
jgi:hypothetical protein